MNCEEARSLLNALADGELDAGHARSLELHLEGCPDCTAELAAIRDLRRTIAGAGLRRTAPAALRQRIDEALPASDLPIPARQPNRRSVLAGFGLGAAVSAVAASGLLVVVTRGQERRRLLGEVVSAHLRSLQGEHLTDVESSYQHTVKPWFNGRLDAAPPVIDLTAQGFTLIGGRLDALDGKTVAAIVYRRRVHVINLFVAAEPTAPRVATMATVQGFNIRHWTERDLSLWAISDLNAEELEEFGRKFEAALNGT